MYVEWKPGLAGHARIGRVKRSNSGKTLYYMTYELTSLKGAGYKSNYIDVESGMHFWISNCRKDGNDTLYPGTIEIDPNAREEYWTEIRDQPENVDISTIRSSGKYSKRRPS
jgi:protein subunit release factor B